MTSDAPAEWEDEPTPAPAAPLRGKLPPHPGSAPEPSTTTAPAAATSDVPQLFFGSVDEFVREKLRYTYTYIGRVGPTGAYRWSAEWWKFPEAISRLDSLWRAWEALRLDGTFRMSVWWRDHADHHMRMLMAPDGPFANSRDTNEVDPTLAAKALVGKTMGERPIGPLPYTAPPPRSERLGDPGDERAEVLGEPAPVDAEPVVRPRPGAGVLGDVDETEHQRPSSVT